MRGYCFIVCWLQIVLVVVSASDRELVATEPTATSDLSNDEMRIRTARSLQDANLRKHQPRRIRGSGDIPAEDQPRSLFVKEVLAREVDVTGRKDPPQANKNQYRLSNHMSWRERMFPPTRSPTIAPTDRPSTSPSLEENNPGYMQQLDRPIRVACAGDSLTRGTSGGNPRAFAYPNQLQNMLGVDFEVFNFGRNAATASRGLSVSYVDQAEFQSSLDAQPDIYLLMLGTNDSRHWATHASRFREDLKQTYNTVRSSLDPSPPRVILAIPPWVKTDNYGVNSDILVNDIRPRIENVAHVKRIQLVNMYNVTVNQQDIFTSDGLHLNEKGYRTLAASWKLAIQCNDNGICELGENCNSCPGDCYVNCS